MSGGGGSGFEGALGTIAPLALMAIPGVGEALAPITEGLEGAGLGADAATAATTGLIGAVTGGGAAALQGKNPLTAALIGGLGSGLGSYALGAGDAASGAAPIDTGSISSSDLAPIDSSPLSDVGTQSALEGNAGSDNLNTPIDAGGGVSAAPTNNLGSGAALDGSSQAPVTGGPQILAGYSGLGTQDATSSPSVLSQFGSYAANNPLRTAIAGDIALSTAQSLMPHPKVNVAKNAAQVKATDPGFYNSSLPAYHMQNTATPYTGNWYTYGEQSQPTPLYSSQTVPGSYAHGGKVKNYAAGGTVSSQTYNPLKGGILHVGQNINAPQVVPSAATNPLAPLVAAPAPAINPPPAINLNNITQSPAAANFTAAPVHQVSPDIAQILQSLSSRQSGMQQPQNNQMAAPNSGMSFSQAFAPAMLGYKHGGQVHKYATGGPVNPLMPSPPTQMPTQTQTSPTLPANPLTIQAAHNVGVALGKHLKNTMMTPPGQVKGAGGGQDDAVPAKLSQDEYVLSADIPAALGDGSSNEGAKKLDQFVKNVRAHKTKNGGKFPPKAKNPLAYLPKGSV